MSANTPSTPYVAPPKELEIRREYAVSWFAIEQLLATAAKTLAASIVGPMSGRRELMAALDPPQPDHEGYIDLSFHEEEFWVDYMADSGDGWNATTSIAWLLGRDRLQLDKTGAPSPQPIPAGQAEHDFAPSEVHHLLEHGEVLIAGGDEVYPTASAEAYQRRLVRPYECARYSQDDPRQILAVPGNHDWYDGLTGFIRLFCQRWDARRWIGAWQTQQWRSYFAVKLPHGWWLWGIDAALGDDFDPPQLDYFHDVAKGLRAHDRVILCIPAPHWRMNRGKQDSARSLREMDDKLAIFQDIATSKGADGIKLILTGDLHYYAHYRSVIDQDQTEGEAGANPDDRNHYVICGGGGAFGLGTICAPDGEVAIGADRAELVDGGLFPDREQSVELRRGIWKFPSQSRGFTGLLVAIQLVALWLIGELRPRGGPATSWIDYAAETSFSLSGLGKFLWEVLKVLPYPALLLGTLAFFTGFIAFAVSGRRPEGSARVAGLFGALHASLQIIGSTSLVWLSAQLVAFKIVPLPTSYSSHLVALILALPLIFLWCGELFALYLFWGHKLLRLHDQEVFSAQGIEDFKSFLKLRIDPDGIMVYPIGVRQVARRWRAAPGVQTDGEPGDDLPRVSTVVTPEGCRRVVDPVEPLAPHLIEQPFRIARGKRP